VKGLVASRSNGKPRGGRRPTRELNA
jgi:hypothetical protein